MDPRIVLELPVTFRTCRREDLPGLEWEGRFADHRSIFEAALEAQERGGAVLLVAVRDRLILAQAFADLERGPDLAFIWAVRVRPALRGVRLGERLVRELEARLAVPRAEVTVDEDAEAALRFWRRLGYRERERVTERWTVTPPGADPVHLEARRRVLHRDLRAAQPLPRRAMASRYP
jgi:ribosomal protein S18 acetylase RimI-like enzyme